MQTEMAEHIYVVGVEVENVRRLRAAHVALDPGGRVIRITGPNRAGKTSLLKTFSFALGGAGEVGEETIHEGAEAGTVRLRLSNGFTIQRRFTEAQPKGYLSVTSADGGSYGQAKVNEWVGAYAFDPSGFLQLRQEQQADILFGLSPQEGLKERLEEIRAARAQRYEERTPHISLFRRANGHPKPEGERPEEVDVTAEMQRLEALEERESERGKLVAEVADAEKRLEAADDAVEECRQEIERLMKALAAAREQEAQLRRDRAEAAGEAEDAKETLEATPSLAGDIQEVRARIRDARELNARLEPWKEWDRAQNEAEEARAERDRLTAEIDALKEEEGRLIAQAGIPVPGLSFDEEGKPVLNEKPLDVASGAERIRAAVAVATALNPTLRLCLVDRGDELDLEQLEALDREAREKDFQVVLCRIGIEGPGEIVVEDGVAETALAS